MKLKKKLKRNLKTRRETLTMIELFSGIGAQIRGIENTNLWDCTVVNTSDIDKDAMVSYAAIHCGLTPELIDTYADYPSEEEMAKVLTERNIGFDFKKNAPYDWYKLAKRKGNEINKYYLACVLSKNLGDISLIKSLDYADFWTYSFPCQDISIAGKQAGIKRGKTRSGLLYEVERLLETAVNNGNQPKYLLLENVKNLVGKKFKSQFDEWISRLDELGYNTYWQVVNGKDCGIPQNRERCFAISIRKDIDSIKFGFAKCFDKGLRLKDLLEENVDEKYFLKTLDNFSMEHSLGCKEQYYKNWNANFKIRKLTPTECWRLMGFEDNDVSRAKSIGMSDSSLYKQAGNSIITNCISLIMEHLYKAQVDNTYICTDEKFYSATAEVKYKSDCGENKPVFVGGIGERNFGKQFRQGNRVYSSENVAMTCLAQPVGNTGGFSYLYAVNDTNNICKLGNIYPSGGQNGNIYNINGISPTISSGETSTKGNGGVGSNNAPKIIVDDTNKIKSRRKLYTKYCR